MLALRNQKSLVLLFSTVTILLMSSLQSWSDQTVIINNNTPYWVVLTSVKSFTWVAGNLTDEFHSDSNAAAPGALNQQTSWKLTAIPYNSTATISLSEKAAFGGWNERKDIELKDGTTISNWTPVPGTAPIDVKIETRGRITVRGLFGKATGLTLPEEIVVTLTETAK